MIKIYNSKFMNNKQRFYKAIIFGLLASIGCSIAFSLFVKVTNFSFSIFYLLSGYFISKTISEVGRGVQVKFSYLGAGLTILSIILTELFIYTDYSVLLQPSYWWPGIQMILSMWLNFNTNSILTIFFQIWAIYIGYTNSSLANF